MRATLAGALLAAVILCGARQQESPPPPPSKKGLQVQMVADALELGIAHATLNVQLGHLITTKLAEGDAPIGDGMALSSSALRALDAQVRPLAAAQVELTFILLGRATGEPAVDGLLLDERYDPHAPNRLGAFDTDEVGGPALVRRVVAALADRFGPASEIGRVRGWIVGNEVNSHWWWYNLGRASLDEVAIAYEAAVRLVHEEVTQRDPDARVYVSLEHHWQARFAAGDERQSCSGRALLDAFARRAREGGDFAWHVAYHPYPEDLFDCRVWEDETALPRVDTPRVTFKNLGVLTDYLQREELLWEGRPRRVILSEQGFHCRDDGEGELDQAAAFAYAWEQVVANPGIDAFHYHRHVDHVHEGGLRFGLWTNRAGSVADPDRKRALWELFRDCDRPEGRAALDRALRRVGEGR